MGQRELLYYARRRNYVNEINRCALQRKFYTGHFEIFCCVVGVNVKLPLMMSMTVNYLFSVSSSNKLCKHVPCDSG